MVTKGIYDTFVGNAGDGGAVVSEPISRLNRHGSIPCKEN